MSRKSSLDKGEAIKIPFACMSLVLCFLFLPFELQTGGRERFGGGGEVRGGREELWEE